MIDSNTSVAKVNKIKMYISVLNLLWHSIYAIDDRHKFLAANTSLIVRTISSSADDRKLYPSLRSSIRRYLEMSLQLIKIISILNYSS